MISSMICMKNASLFVRLNGSVSRSPFGQANGASVCPVFALPSAMAPVPGNIVSTVTSARDASEPAMVYQPAECRARYHSQPSLNDMSSTAAPSFANLTLPVSAHTCHVLPTPVKHTVLEFLLQDYDCPSKPALRLGFKSGFRIHSSIGSDPLKGNYENHKSVNNNLSFVQTKLDKEKSLGRVAGPFQNPPLSNMVFSPLGLVPKKEPEDFRLIHDLSYPKDNSVNSHIAPEFSAVSFEMLDDCIRIMLELGKGCLIAKADLNDAFRIIPISPLDYHLLGFKFKGQFYFDMCLPMGCSTSCQTFESLSRAVQWICVHKAKILHISHIIDDFIIFGQTISRCQLYLDRFFDICRMINLPVKHSKTVLPTSTAVLHGIEVDSIAQTIKLPQDKLLALRAKLIAMSKRKTVSLRDVQSLVGSLMFSSRVISPGRCFVVVYITSR